MKKKMEKETMPTQWIDGIIMKRPQKGNHKDFNNLCGITLISVPDKIQNGFRTDHECIDNILILKNIIEQVLEWRYIIYIDKLCGH